MTSLRKTLETDKFVTTCELIPGRGYRGRGIDNIFRFAEEAQSSNLIDALTITDNAGGNPALSPEVLGKELVSIGSEMLIHVSCKDLNRNSLESHAYSLQRNGLTNILMITGDYPVSGYLGISKPVFDIDSVSAIYYLRKMNEGLKIKIGRKESTLDRTDFLIGCAASPFKWTEGSSVMQYRKLEKKLQAGAHFVITQLGFDSRKYAEFIRYVRDYRQLNLPLIGSVYVLTAGAAAIMNRGEVPGCAVNEDLLQLLRQEAKADDKGKGKRTERAAQQVAILKGLGYRGAHIEGFNLRFKDVQEIMEQAESIRDNWRDYYESIQFSPSGNFYYFKEGEQKPLNTSSECEFSKTRRRMILSPVFWAMQIMHNFLFVKGTLGFRLMTFMSKRMDRARGMYRFFYFFERSSKRILFDCRECGDCALYELHFTCPESYCPKGMRNCPCGGSRADGHCEVFEDRLCIWERAYWRAKLLKQLPQLGRTIAPRNWELFRTSAWGNYYVGWDHNSVQLDLPKSLPAGPDTDSEAADMS